MERNCTIKFKRIYLKNQKHFLEFSLRFRNLRKILLTLEKMIRLVAQIFVKLSSPKNVATWMPESSCFRTPFRNQRVNASQTLLKSARQHFYPNFTLISDKLSWKTFILVRSEMLGVFVNTLMTDHMHSRQNGDKFHKQVQTQLS